MELMSRLSDIQKRIVDHRDVLLTEEATKTALIMPFLQALGYDVFNPSELIPEYSADVGTKKGEKVDYAINLNGKITILIECKPVFSELNVNHASQLFRYFSVTDSKIALLTNGVHFNFYSDLEEQNKMDKKPFFSFNLEVLKQTDIKTLEKFTKSNFDIDKILQEAGSLKLQQLLRAELEKEFNAPSEEFTKLMATRVHGGRITAAVKDNFSKHLVNTISVILRDMVNDRLSSALDVASPISDQTLETPDNDSATDIITTDEEWAGFYIIQAIASKTINPKRVILRDSKSYCAILLDDNNRKTLARLHFNSSSKKYIGLFDEKTEQKHQISEPVDIYGYSSLIEQRIANLDGSD